jgi:drug/metabolite transporter (DMT)-like permease
VDALVLVAVQQAAGLVWASLLFVATVEHDMVEVLAAVPSAEICYAIISGLLYYAGAYWLYLSVLGRVSAALAGGSFNIIPIVTVAVAFVFLGERLAGLQIVGAILILLSAGTLFWLTRGPAISERQLA